MYYGDWDEARVRQALEFELVILQANGISRPLMELLQKGPDNQSGTQDDIKVLAYVSIGEDESPPRGLAPAKMPGPMRYKEGLIPEHNDFPTYYLDEVKLLQGKDGFFAVGADGERRFTSGQDGLPDENGVWGSFYTSAGDPAWGERVKTRMAEIEQALGPDGFFLDTLDTGSRWGAYPWMERDMAALVQRIREWNPDSFLVANRGLSLFYDYATAMRTSLDGVMYESFVTDWDWQRMIGIQHPVLADQVEVLRTTVLPQATASDGFFLLFLNYRAPGQPDFVNFLHRERELLSGIDCATYWTTPDLQKIDPPPSAYFPPNGGALTTGLDVLRAERTPTGGVKLTLKTGAVGLGRDTFIDLLAGPAPSALARRLTFAYPEVENGEVTLELWGVRDSNLWARLLGSSGTQTGEFQPAAIPEPGLPAVADLQAQSLDGKIQLSWEGVPGGAYLVYAGPSPDKLKKVTQVTRPFFVVPNLLNDRPYAFAVAQIKGGKQVALSDVIYGAPRDKTPPPVPEKVTVAGTKVSWAPVSASDLSGYRVYVWPEKGGLRLPLLAEADQTELEVENAQSGLRYNVYVTAMDESGNESRPAPRATLGP